jgi:hypothetical protein
MKNPETYSGSLEELESQYDIMRNELAKISYLSAGSIYYRPPGASGARCQWSIKDNKKTVSLALSPEQAEWLEAAIEEHRRVKKVLAEMHRLSRRIMLRKFPDAERRKPINKKVMRLI